MNRPDLDPEFQRKLRDLDDQRRRLDRILDYLAISLAVDRGNPRDALAIAFRQKGALKA